MHFVGARFHPVKKPADPVPSAAFPKLVRTQVRAEIAIDDPFLVSLWQLFKRAMDIDLLIQRSRNQILLALAHLTGLKRLYDAVCDAESPVRHRTVEINADGASESAAAGAGAEWVVKRK